MASNRPSTRTRIGHDGPPLESLALCSSSSRRGARAAPAQRGCGLDEDCAQDTRPIRPVVSNSNRIPLFPTQAAEVTGGRAFLTGDVVGAFRDVLKDFRSSYVLRYTLHGVPSPSWHAVAVKVPSCPTCSIRARRGYMGQ